MYCLTGLNCALLGLALMITLYPELVLTQASIECSYMFSPGYTTSNDAAPCLESDTKSYECKLSTCTINKAPWDKFSFQNCSPYKPGYRDLDTSQPPKAVKPSKYSLKTGNLNVQGTDKQWYRCPIGSPTDPKLNTQRATCSSCLAKSFN